MSSTYLLRCGRPEAITHADVAAELLAATNGAVEYVDIPDDIAALGMTRAGMPDAVVRQVVAIYAMLRRGAGERVTAAVEALTGRAPRGFALFARDHAHLFTRATVGAGR